MSNKIVEYKDLIAFHPGQYVGELIEDYNVTQKEFAETFGSFGKDCQQKLSMLRSLLVRIRLIS